MNGRLCLHQSILINWLVGWLVVGVLWHINHYGLFNAKSGLHMNYGCNHFFLYELTFLLNSCFDLFNP